MATVILDLDGPLLDGRYRHYACYSRILVERGCLPMGLERYWQMKRERKDRRDQLSATHAESIYDEFVSRWLRLIETPEYLALDRVYPWVVEMLGKWKHEGRRLVLATQRHDAFALRNQLAIFALDRFLDHVVVCDHREGGLGKARLVREVAGSNADDEFVWIGDTEVDIEAARLFGCPVWAVCCGLRTEAYLRSLSPDHTCCDLREVELEGI